MNESKAIVNLSIYGIIVLFTWYCGGAGALAGSSGGSGE